MNLECLNDIITDNLAIHIDLTSLKSWDLNTGFTSISLTKWSGAVSDNINLLDFGLTAFDNGRTDKMWDSVTFLPQDNLFTMYRVGYNDVINPTTGNTSGLTVTTRYDLYPISAITSGTSGNYFELDGGYLQGFFKLDGYNYTMLPARYNYGITIETLVYLHPDSKGVFYTMGARAEDKYNPYFSGETITGTTTVGVVTSENNYLDSIIELKDVKKGFILPEDMTTIVYSSVTQTKNITNNIIAFELTQDKHLAYKYIDENGLIATNSSTAIVTATGFTLISIVFTPDSIIDPSILECAKRRTGKLIFYVNGRAVWIIKEFPEFYFKAIQNQKEKQIGVPYSISWGGGSFGLEHSWHYDYQTYAMYGGQNDAYVKSNFFVQGNPISGKCNVIPNDDYKEGLLLDVYPHTFTKEDPCDPSKKVFYPVMSAEYSGTTGNSSIFFIKFNHPISVLSNRDYVVDVEVLDTGFTKSIGDHGEPINNKVSLLIYSDSVDISIMSDIEYTNPEIPLGDVYVKAQGLHPFVDGQEYEYIYKNGIMYYGDTGLPVYDKNGFLIRYTGEEVLPNEIEALRTIKNGSVSGLNEWHKLQSVFRIPEGSGQQFVNIGVLIETSGEFNFNTPLFFKDFTYTAADILVQDERKDGLTIQSNFKPSFIGGIQKLRVYDRAFTSTEILHNALMESKKNPDIIVDKGGRIIHR